MSTETVPISFQFTEQMKGYISPGATEYIDGYADGKKAKNYIMFELTIRTEDVDEFVANPAHECGATGYIDCDSLGGKCALEKGAFNLFINSDGPNQKQMRYRLLFKDGNGNPLTFYGYKEVVDDGLIEIWHDTSTLYTTIYAGHVTMEEQETAEVKARGILHILPLDFAHQLTTFRSDGKTLAQRAHAFETFGRMFLGSLWEVYGPKWCMGGLNK